MNATAAPTTAPGVSNLHTAIVVYFLEADTARIVLLCVGALGFVISNIISSVHFWSIVRSGLAERKFTTFFPTVHKRVLIQILWIQITSLTNFLSLLFPRIFAFFSFIAHSFQAFALYRYVNLLGDLVGGREQTLALSCSRRAKIYAAFPFGCCFAPLMTPTSLTPRSLTIARLGVLQSTFVQPSLSFLAVFFQLNQLYTPGSFEGNNSYVYLLVIAVVSTLISMYCVGIIQNSIRESVKTNLRLKFLLVQILIPLFAVQSLLISVIYKHALQKADNTFPRPLAAVLYNCFIICLECIPLALLCKFAYPPNEAYFTKKTVTVAIQTEEDGVVIEEDHGNHSDNSDVELHEHSSFVRKKEGEN